MANSNVKFLSVRLKATFEALEVKDSLTLYWIEETQELYKGGSLFGTGRQASDLTAGLMSPEDKSKLDALVENSGGIVNLSPVDGTIVVENAADGGRAIGVRIASDEGNALTAVDGGLFVPTAVIPEYAIEKQEIAEDGYSVSYKLKKTVGENSSYVGDVINIGKDMVLQEATLETVVMDDVPYEGAKVGDPYIKLLFNDPNASGLYIPVKGLVDTYQAGDGIEIVDNVVRVKIAENAHGLVAVDGALALNLATEESDGAMSKEDKTFISSIPTVYATKDLVKETAKQVKYRVSDAPYGTLVSYGEDEIRIMCPADAEYVKQNVGAGGDTDTYYFTFKTYAPSEDAVGYIEHLNGQSDSEILKDLSVDEFGRKYQPTWLSLAKYDEATDVWNYYGKSSSVGKYIGWDYRIEWYDADGVMISSDSIRINLSNEDCHHDIKPYYVGGLATSAEVNALAEQVSAAEEAYTWGTL